MRSKNADRISSLHEDIQSRILSLMPTKFGVQTCVLSKRWRYTWMSITNLDFDDITPLGFSSLETFVDRVLGCCKSSQIESLRLNFFRTRIQESSISNWIDKAITLSARELDIQYKLFELPSSLFTCTTLTKLKICLGSIWECAPECVPVVSLPCLKTLDVAVFTSPFSSAFKLIAGSPMLEDLSLQVVMHCSEEDFVFDIPTLKRLKLHLSRSENTNKLVLRVPKLERLLFDGTLYSVFVMEDVSSLVEASFSFEDKSFNNHMVELLKGISGVKLLFLKKVRDTQSQDSSLLKLISASPLPVFLIMERLELKGFWHLELISSFLQSSPELKEIYIEKLQGSRWIAPKLVPVCMLAKLTTIKFLNFKWRKCDIPFLKFLLGNAKVLKTVTIYLEKSSIEEEAWLDQQLRYLPRASRCCEIHFHRY
ncbi:FBD-associated F-box protein At4g10400-like [Bidens hawaiensis]|uniref:FBD-associated F-box protein At4g10400-like n=1 Tax=Bidens hawaiensis TaxID=980011 RepID=UPI00404AE30F